MIPSAQAASGPSQDTAPTEPTRPVPWRGLNAFPLTPLKDDRIDEDAFVRIVDRLADSGVDAITVLGSTGSYAYLSREERARVVRLASEVAGGVPVMAGIGALRTSHVLQCARDAQEAGAAGLLLAPVSYQALTADDVYGLFADVSAEASVPVVVYDNPGTTHFRFTDELYAAVASLPCVASIKIPGVPPAAAEAEARIAQLRALLPTGVSLGVSGDAFGAAGLNAGCELWYSAVGGTLPAQMLEITRAAQAGEAERALDLSARLQPLWDLFARHGSLRVTAAIAEELGLAEQSCLPLPLCGLSEDGRAKVRELASAGIVRG